MGTAWFLSRGRRHWWACCSSQARSPLVVSRRKEVAKQLRGDSLMRSSWPHSRHRSRACQYQSQSPGWQQPSKAPPQSSMRKPHRHTSPSLSPPHPTCADENCSLSKLHLQPQWWESRRRWVSRMWPESALMHATGHSCSPPGSATECSPQDPTRKQVWLNLANDLGDTPSLCADLASFLGGTTDEWINASHPPAPSATSSWRPPCDGGDQHHATPMGGAQPKTGTAQSSCQSSQGQVKKYTRPHRVPWGVHPGTHGQKQAAL